MKTIGIIGGMSWESTAQYYKGLNEGVRNRLGGLHSAQILMTSVDFAPIEELQAKGEWGKAGEVLADEARKLKQAGADCIILATNTMHKVADHIEAAAQIPFLHLADVTAQEIKKAGLFNVGLLATIYTMEQDFYAGRMAKHGLEIMVPESATERQEVNRIIFDELCMGQIKDSSRQAFLTAANYMKDRGAECILFGCTEIGMLIKPEDFDVPVFDTTEIHIQQALDFALSRH